jgi:hypothetical protein
LIDNAGLTDKTVDDVVTDYNEFAAFKYANVVPALEIEEDV